MRISYRDYRIEQGRRGFEIYKSGKLLTTQPSLDAAKQWIDRVLEERCRT